MAMTAGYIITVASNNNAKGDEMKKHTVTYECFGREHKEYLKTAKEALERCQQLRKNGFYANAQWEKDFDQRLINSIKD